MSSVKIKTSGKRSVSSTWVTTCSSEKMGKGIVDLIKKAFTPHMLAENMGFDCLFVLNLNKYEQRSAIFF